MGMHARWGYTFILSFAVVFFTAQLALAQSGATPPWAEKNLSRVSGTADYAFVNGKIYTMNEKQPWAEAVAVEENKIVYVGDAKGLVNFIGYGTEVVNLGGRMLMPGFVDAHLHPMAGSLLSRGVDLQTDDKQELFSRLKTYIADHPDEEIILGYGLRYTLFSDGDPTAEMLDKLESKRPVYLWFIDGHAAWVNSKALELAKIDKDTPDTVPGYSFFKRDKNGSPTGYVIELPAQMQVYSAINDPDEKFMRAGLNEWLPRMSAYGITAALDAGIQGMGQDEGFQMYLELEKQGVLPLRVIGSYYWNDPAIDPLPILVELNKKYNTELVKAERLKINLDGGDDKHNALFVDPYTDKPDIKVQPIIPYDILNKVVTRADAQGIDVYCHCFGDLAVRKLLDAVEGAIKVNPDRTRHHTISHMILVHKDDVPRFAKLGVIPDVQAGWGALDPHVSTISMRTLGKARIDRYLGIKELMDAGAAVSLSSDWPAAGYLSNLNPLVTIQIAVTRQNIGKPDMPRLGGKKAMVPLAAALRAHTLGGANVLAMADQIGSIETGKFADLIVLERNLFDVKPHDIHRTKVQMTMMNGKIVHNAESAN